MHDIMFVVVTLEVNLAALLGFKVQRKYKKMIEFLLLLELSAGKS